MEPIISQVDDRLLIQYFYVCTNSTPEKDNHNIIYVPLPKLPSLPTSTDAAKARRKHAFSIENKDTLSPRYFRIYSKYLVKWISRTLA
jgi:hypothetical protein